MPVYCIGGSLITVSVGDDHDLLDQTDNGDNR